MNLLRNLAAFAAVVLDDLARRLPGQRVEVVDAVGPYAFDAEPTPCTCVGGRHASCPTFSCPAPCHQVPGPIGRRQTSA